MSEPGSASFDFSGRTVLVTGASRGIGFAVAKDFADAGADLIILADDEAIFEAAKALGRDDNHPVRALQCDIADSAAVTAAFREIRKIDILVNNAGLERITPVLEPDSNTDETFRRIIDINVMGTWHVTRSAVGKMQAGSSIVITCSIWSHTAVSEFSAYCSSKHANLGFLRSMAAELAPKGIRVNGVCPGWVRTDASMRSLKMMAERSGRSEPAMLEEIVGNQLLGGLMEPGDVSATYLFLASDAAASITGQTVSVNRGELMC